MPSFPDWIPPGGGWMRPEYLPLELNSLLEGVSTCNCSNRPSVGKGAGIHVDGHELVYLFLAKPHQFRKTLKFFFAYSHYQGTPSSPRMLLYAFSHPSPSPRAFVLHRFFIRILFIRISRLKISKFLRKY